jgi:hypothetical protein
MANQLIATARNFHLNIEGDGTLSPWIEAVLITLVPSHGFGPMGEPVITREAEALRFQCEPAAARKLAADLYGWADEIEAELERLSSTPKTE